MGTDDGGRGAASRRGMVMVIVAVWTGWAVAVLVAPILKQAEGEGLGVVGRAALLQRGGARLRIPVRLPHRSNSKAPSKMDKIVRDLADMYAMHCACADEAACPCAKDAEHRVREALDNAVDREFAPPNMYYRSRNGYDIRLRGFQGAKTHYGGGLVHDKFLDIEPIKAAWRKPTSPAPVLPKQVAAKRGLPPIHVQGRFVHATGGSDTFVQSHLTQSAAAVRPRTAALAQRQQTTKLWQFDYIPLADEEFPGKHPTVFEAEAAREEAQEALAAACREEMGIEGCKDLEKEKEEEEEEEGGAGEYKESWFDDFLDYAQFVLEDGELEEQKEASGVPHANDAAFAIPYQARPSSHLCASYPYHPCRTPPHDFKPLAACDNIDRKVGGTQHPRAGAAASLV
jgi:hypothetical protein